jgi:hypothetical protein
VAPPSAAEAERERQRDAALAFGRNLRRWRRSQGWAQDTPAAWGKAIGSLHVYASQWSQIETGVMVAPTPHLFICFGHQNQRLAAGDLGVIRDRKLKDRVAAARAIEDDDGPWDAVAFFAAYIGVRPFPDDLAPAAPEITDEAAAEWSDTLRDWFQRTAETAQLDPLEAMVALMRCVDAEIDSDRQAFQRVLLGFSDYQAAELLDAWHREANGARDWISAWRRTLGLKADGPREPWSDG